MLTEACPVSARRSCTFAPNVAVNDACVCRKTCHVSCGSFRSLRFHRGSKTCFTTVLSLIGFPADLPFWTAKTGSSAPEYRCRFDSATPLATVASSSSNSCFAAGPSARAAPEKHS